MDGCIFCAIAAGQAPASLVHHDERFLVFLDIYPARPGHLLVVPRRHAPRLGDLVADEAPSLCALVARENAALRSPALAEHGIRCDDVTVLLNDGAAANQSVPHLHVHLVPRRKGDFPTVLGKLLARPIQPLLGAAPRARLDAQATALRVLLP